MEGLFIHISNKLSETRFGKEENLKVLSLFELKTWKFWRAVLAEFIGTLLFVFIGCASTVPISGTAPPALSPQSTIKIAFAFGLAIMALIQMFGHISGGHFNPAVSIGLSTSFQITPVRAVLYVVAQTVGAIIGGLILKGVTPDFYHSSLGVTSVNPNLNAGQGVGIEIILTFCLVLVIVATTDGNRTDFGSASMKIGLTVTLLHMSCITLTGSSMNPARSLGSAVASNSYSDHWVYWVGPIIGGCLACLLYKFLFSPYKGAISSDAAVQKLLVDGDMIAIPRDYLSGQVNNGPNGVKIETIKL